MVSRLAAQGHIRLVLVSWSHTQRPTFNFFSQNWSDRVAEPHSPAAPALLPPRPLLPLQPYSSSGLSLSLRPEPEPKGPEPEPERPEPEPEA